MIKSRLKERNDNRVMSYDRTCIILKKDLEKQDAMNQKKHYNNSYIFRHTCKLVLGPQMIPPCDNIHYYHHCYYCLLCCAERHRYNYGFFPHLGFHVHEVQTFGVDPQVDPDDLVSAGAGLGVDLACKKGGSVGGNFPAVLQEEALKVMHFFTDSLAGAQTLRNQYTQ